MDPNILNKNKKMLNKITNGELEHFPWEAEDFKYQHKICHNGSDTLQVTKGNKIIYLHSTYHPEEESKKYMKFLVSPQDDLFILFGLGYFYHAKELIRLASPQAIIVLMEPDECIFRAAVQHIALENVVAHENVKLVISDQPEEYTSILQQWMDWVNVDHTCVIVAPGYAVLYKECLRHFLKALEAVYMANKLKQNTMLAYADQWGKNLIINLKEIFNSYSIQLFEGKIKNMPIVIVSAGPSLNKNVHLLKKIKGKVLIVCVYTAYNVLREHQIEPDFVMTIEANQLIHETDEEKAEIFTTPLIYTPYTEPQLLQKHHGNKYVIPSVNDTILIQWMNAFEKPVPMIASGGSVTTTAIGFAMHFCCNPVIFIGLDLAYSEERSHAKGTYYDRKNLLESLGDNKIYVEDIEGNPIATDVTLNTYRLWIEGVIEKFGGTFLDCTEGGAKIQGTTILPFAEAIAQYAQQDYEDCIQQLCHPKEEQKLFSKKEIKQLHGQLVASVQAFGQMRSYLNENILASKGLREIYENKGTSNNEKALLLLQTMQQNDEKMDQYKKDIELMDYYFQKAYFESQQIQDKMGNEGLFVAKKSIVFYEGLQTSIEALLPELKTAIENIERTLLCD